MSPMPEMKELGPEERLFAEEHYRLLLKFMADRKLGDDFYGPLAEQYLKTVQIYLGDPKLQRYAFSTILWYRLQSTLMKIRRKELREASNKPLEELPVEPSCTDEYGELWTEIQQEVSERQLELLKLKVLGYSTKQIAAMHGCTPKAVRSRIYRIRNKLKNKGPP